jgi:hypothetical protein
MLALWRCGRADWAVLWARLAHLRNVAKPVEEDAMELIIKLLIEVIAGAVGGNAARAAAKNISLETTVDRPELEKGSFDRCEAELSDWGQH